MRHATMLVVILAFVPLASATAQVPPPVKVGDRVRVTAPDLGRREGTVRLLTTDSLVMRPEYVFVMRPEYVTPNRLAIPLASVTRLELSRPGGSQAGQGALNGLAIGILGGAVAAAALCENGSDFLEVAVGTCVLAGAVIVGAGGALVGAIVGAMITGTRWEEVPLDQFRVNLGPQRDGRWGLGASVRF